MSPLFCNIYYGAVEHELFDSHYTALGLAHERCVGAIPRQRALLTDTDSMIVRLMDDYIMISTERKAVETFLQIAHTRWIVCIARVA